MFQSGERGQAQMRERSAVVERSAVPEEPLPHISIRFWPIWDWQSKAHGLRLFFSEMIRAKAWVAARTSKPEYMFNVWLSSEWPRSRRAAS